MLHEIDSLVFHVSRNYTQWLTFSPTLRLEMTGKWRCHSSVPVFSGLPREKHFGGEGHRVRRRITQQRETSSAHPKIRVLRLKYDSVLILYRLASITFFQNSEYSYHGRNEPETLLSDDEEPCIFNCANHDEPDQRTDTLRGWRVSGTLPSSGSMVWRSSRLHFRHTVVTRYCTKVEPDKFP